MDAPDSASDPTPVRQFATARGIGRVTVAVHPSGRVVQANDREDGFDS